MPRVSHDVPRLLPLLRVLAVQRVPRSLELALDDVEFATLVVRSERALPAVPIARLVVLVRRARLVVRAPAKVLPPVVAFRDLVEILAGRETTGAGRLSAVDPPARRRPRGDLLERALAVARGRHRLRLVGGRRVGAHSVLDRFFRVVQLSAVEVDRLLGSRSLVHRASAERRSKCYTGSSVPGSWFLRGHFRAAVAR